MTASRICKSAGMVMSIAVAGAFLYMGATIAGRYPGNHGAEPMSGLFYFFAVSLVGAVAIFFRTPKTATTLVAASLLGMAAVSEMDRRNIMMSYDEWVRHGMPGWGQSAESAVDEDARFWEEQEKREYTFGKDTIGCISDVGDTALKGLDVEWLRFTVNPFSGIFNAVAECTEGAFEDMCDSKGLTREGAGFPPAGIVVDDGRFIPELPAEGKSAWGWSRWEGWTHGGEQGGRALLVLYFVLPRDDKPLGDLYIFIRYKEALREGRQID